MPHYLFITAFYFKMAYLSHLFKLKNVYPKLYYCGLSLHNPSLRLPASSRKDWFIALRIIKRLMGLILNSKPKMNVAGHEEAILDSNAGSKEIRLNYVNKMDSEKSRLFLSKEDLISGASPLLKLFFIIYLFLVVFPLFILSVISRDKSKFPLMVFEILECSALNEILNRNNIQKLHYFSIYERDANICAFITMKYAVIVNKITSEVPLVFWNKIIVSDSLSLCFKYQEDEMKKFNETIFVKEVKQWAPEQIFIAKKEWFNKVKNSKKGNIGFYSSGNWLRDEIGNTNLDKNEAQNEDALLKSLCEFVNTHSDLKLQIFLHPMEKDLKYQSKVEAHYKMFLGDKIVIVGRSIRTSDAFDQSEIAIAQFSTIMFERIYFGFKSIIVPFGFENSFIEESAFRNILAYSSNEMIAKLKAALAQSEEEYYQSNKLFGYRQSDYFYAA